MKVNLTSLLIRPVVKEEESDNEENTENIKANEEVEDNEYEDIFNEMEVVIDEPKKKKKIKRIIQDEVDASKVALKKIKKKVKNDDEIDQIKVKTKITKVKNIFAK